jgi:hypothetical protein
MREHLKKEEGVSMGGVCQACSLTVWWHWFVCRLGLHSAFFPLHRPGTIPSVKKIVQFYWTENTIAVKADEKRTQKRERNESTQGHL